MALDLNVSPYYNDFDANKQFEKVLFKPGVAVQARELTQLQSYLSNAIKNHATFSLTEGARVSGGEGTILRKPYIKINDVDADGATIDGNTLEDYIGDTVTGSVTGIKAKVIGAYDGTDGDATNKKTLYLSYIGGNPTAAGSNENAVHFDATETLTVTSDVTARDGNTFVVDNNTSLTAIENNYYGFGLFFVIADGVFFLKNQFVTHLRQELLIDKYNPIQSCYVGLRTKEIIVTSDDDNSLLDPATGTFNYNAPGADRYKVYTEIDFIGLEEDGDEEFVATDKLVEGKYYQKTPEDVGMLAEIGRIIAQRTREESGDYVVKKFDIKIDEHLDTGINQGKYTLADGGDATKLSVSVGGGTAYVAGFRHQMGASEPLETSKGIDTYTAEGQIVSTQYGNYFLVDEFCGTWNIADGDLITLHNQTKSAVTNGTYGSTSAPNSSQKIGQARVKHVSYESGTIGSASARYKVYIYDIKITNGILEDARGLYFSNSTDSGFADLVLNVDGNAEVKERSSSSLVFRNPRRNAKTLAAAGGGTYDTQYYYQEEYEVNFTGVTGSASISALSGTQFPYAATPTQTILDENFTLIATQSCIIDGVTYVEGQVIPLNSGEVTCTSSALSFALGVTVANFTGKLFVNVVNTDSVPVPKNLISDIWVKIDTATNPNGRYGPWNLGIPDVFKIQNIYVGSSYSDSGQDVKSKFILDSGQTDNLYGHAKLNPITGYTVPSNAKILVKLSAFEPNYAASHGTWFAVDSYPVDDTGAGGIYTYEIPVYKSQNGGKFDLRDCIDFRPYVVATASTSTLNISDATENPAPSGQIDAPADGIQIPNPITNFSTDIECYLPRIDTIVLDETGTYQIIRGISNKNPKPPVVEYGMKLAELNIPAYPSISPFLGKLFSRADLTVGKRLLQTRRYTMSDISAIENRINRLEYYTALSLMEREADSLKILDENGNDRFKNGIFINPFTSHALSAVNDPGFKCSIDMMAKKVNPYYYEENINIVYNPTTSSGIQQTGPLLTLPYENVVFNQNRFSSKSRNCVGELLFDWVGDLEIFPRSSNYVDTSQTEDLEVVDDSLAQFSGELANAINSAQIVSSYELSFAGIDNEPKSKAFKAESEPTTADIGFETSFGDSGDFTATASDVGGRFFVEAGVSGTVDVSGTTTVDGSVTTSGVLTGDVITQTETITATATTRMLTASSGVVGTNTMRLGSKLISVDINTFMSANTILCIANRLKPNTKMYAFFDEIAQTENITPVDPTQAANIILNYPEDQWASRASQFTTASRGTAPTTNEDGEFACLYRIPAGTFITGDRLLRFVDDVQNRRAMITCSCNASYTSFGLSTVSQETVISTQIPNISFGQSAPKPSNVGSWTHVTGVEIANLALDINSVADVKASSTLDVTAAAQLHLEVTGGFDPIAQTFTNTSTDGIFVTQLKVFFRSKSETEGITCQLREVVNGYPSKSILPYGECYLKPSEVNVTTETSDGYINFADGSGNSYATTFTFRAPVYLKPGEEYCFVLMPAGNSPDYNVWVSELGENKVNTNQRIFAEDTNIDGILFTSANNSTWNAHQAEDITYQLLRANFDTTSGTANFTNENVDWLKTTNYSGGRPKVGDFVYGYDVSAVNTGSGYEAGDIITLNTAVDSSGNTLTGVKILVTAPAVGAPGPVSAFTVYDPGTLSPSWVDGENPGTVGQISITSSDIGGGTSAGAGSSASFSLTLNRGFVKAMNSLDEVCTVKVLNGAFRDQTSGDIITPIGTGTTYFDVEDIQDKTYNQLRTTISSIIMKETDIAHSVAVTKSSGVGSIGTSYRTVTPEARQDVEEEMAVRSYSNEGFYLSGASTKTLNNRMVFSTTNAKLSPVIDTTRNSMLMKRNHINNDNTGEEGNTGNAYSKFINKPVILADGQEAEDILVQVALKQPTGSSIEVWGKFLAPDDDADFTQDIPWIPLQTKNEWSPATSATSTTSFVDYGYGIPDSYLDGDGVFNYSTDRVTELTITTAGSGYTSAPTLTFDSGSKATAYALLTGTTLGNVILTAPGRDESSSLAVKVGTEFGNTTSYATGQQVFYGANLYTVDVGGTTDASTFPTHTTGTVTIGTAQLTYAGVAAKVTASVNTVTFKKFKKFSTKLVMLSSNTSSIPEAKELRCIALQA